MDKGKYIALGVGLIIFGLVVIDIGRTTWLATIGFFIMCAGEFESTFLTSQI